MTDQSRQASTSRHEPFADLQKALILGHNGLRLLQANVDQISLALSEVDDISSAWKARAERAEAVCQYIERYDQVEKLHRLTQKALDSWRELSSDD